MGEVIGINNSYRSQVENMHIDDTVFVVPRVHGFMKVEMFGVTAAETGEESHQLYLEMIQIQKELFSQLGIHFQVSSI